MAVGACAASGATAPAHAAAPASGGAQYTTPPAVIDAVLCKSRCADTDVAAPGGTVRITGRRMDDVRTVTFLGRPGRRDDATATALRSTGRRVDVRVPAGAPTGRLRVRNADGTGSRASLDVLAIGLPDAAGSKGADVDTSDRIDAHVDTSTVFQAGYRKAALTYTVTDEAPVPLAIELVRAADGASVARWSPGAVAPGAEQRIEWDGLAGGRPAPEGRYEFRVTADVPGATAASAGEPQVADSFRLLDHKFPIRGKHGYGEFGASFGGGRGHQAQDVIADCGTPLVAARGGKVLFKGTQSRAGNYVVIDGAGTDLDYVYMHLEQPALVDKGEKVATGQRIGNVGRTGRASACLLHFELWSGPGWYRGGKPMDPISYLRAWDTQSGSVRSAVPLRKKR